MSPESKYFVARKFLEGLVLSALVLVAFMHFVGWPAYAVAGSLVAVFLAVHEIKQLNGWLEHVLYLPVAGLNALMWPAMSYLYLSRK